MKLLVVSDVMEVEGSLVGSKVTSSQLISSAGREHSSPQIFSRVLGFSCLLDTKDVLVEWRVGSKTVFFSMQGVPVS